MSQSKATTAQTRKQVSSLLIAALLCPSPAAASKAIRSTAPGRNAGPSALPVALSLPAIGASPSTLGLPEIGSNGSMLGLPPLGAADPKLAVPGSAEAAHPAAGLFAQPANLPSAKAAEAHALLGSQNGALPQAGAPAWSDPAAEQTGALGGSENDSSRKNPEQAARQLGRLFDGVKIYLTQHGQDPIATDLASLDSVLAARPELRDELNRRGRIRLVLNKERPGALAPEALDSVREALGAAGLKVSVDVEKLSIDWKRKEAAAKEIAQLKRSGSGWALRALTWPLREFAYLGRTLTASVTTPTRSEVFWGVVSKGPAFVAAFFWWSKVTLPSHPLAFGLAIGLSLTLEIFHGLWIATWQNFQNFVYKQRGPTYQAFFNFFYMQLTGAIFRIIAWTVIAATVPPWTLQYWKDMGIMVVFGTISGVLGYIGLNELYNKGVIKRGLRSFIQQARDTAFLVAGTFLFSGAMGVFWKIFLAQVAIDLALFIWNYASKARPIAYGADAAIAATGEFQGMYPVNPQERVHPLKQALFAIPFVKMIWDGVAALVGRLKGSRR